MGNTKQHDTGLFLTIVGLLAVPLVFLLQSNGVVTIKWLPSLFVYLAILGAFIWAYFRWSEPSKWKVSFRYGVLAVLVCSLAALSCWGVVSQYDRENPEQVLVVTSPALPKPPTDWGETTTEHESKQIIHRTRTRNSPGGIQQYSQGANSPNVVTGDKSNVEINK